MRAQDALRLAVPRLQEAGIEDGSRDARVLLAHALGISHDRLTLKLQDEMTAPQEALYGSQAGTCVTDIQFGVGQHYPGDEVGRIALHCHAQL